MHEHAVLSIYFYHVDESRRKIEIQLLNAQNEKHFTAQLPLYLRKGFLSHQCFRNVISLETKQSTEKASIQCHGCVLFFYLIVHLLVDQTDQLHLSKCHLLLLCSGTDKLVQCASVKCHCQSLSLDALHWLNKYCRNYGCFEKQSTFNLMFN